MVHPSKPQNTSWFVLLCRINDAYKIYYNSLHVLLENASHASNQSIRDEVKSQAQKGALILGRRFFCIKVDMRLSNSMGTLDCVELVIELDVSRQPALRQVRRLRGVQRRDSHKHTWHDFEAFCLVLVVAFQETLKWFEGQLRVASHSNANMKTMLLNDLR
jgi:hypothetical protein